MENLITTDTIMKWFAQQVENKNPIDKYLWLEGAMKLNVLLQGEQESLFELEQLVAKMRTAMLVSNQSASHAKIAIEATDEYKNCRIQKAKIERIIEFIRIAKAHSRVADDLMKSN